MRNLLVLLVTATVSLGLMLEPSRAELSDVEILFVRADENGDLYLSQTEVLKIAIIHFSLSDSNQDDKLQEQEIGELASSKEFTDNDSDGDGTLSLKEVIDEKLNDFHQADQDKDGRLSLDEVRRAYSE